MKFGKYLAKRQLDLPEYANYFINYKALKKVGLEHDPEWHLLRCFAARDFPHTG